MTIHLRYDEIEQHDPWGSQRASYRWDLCIPGQDVVVDMTSENRDHFDFRERVAVVKDKVYRLKASARGRAAAAGLTVKCEGGKPYDRVLIRFDQP